MFSYLTNTSAPVRAESLGAGSMGVRSTAPARMRWAACTSASVIVIKPAFPAFGGVVTFVDATFIDLTSSTQGRLSILAWLFARTVRSAGDDTDRKSSAV